MTPDQWEKVSYIFHSATALEPRARAAFLDQVCDGDETLRGEVESLLSAHAEAAEFIEAPAVKGISLDISEMPSLTGSFFSHYRIEKSIGRGGMGEVYLATDMRLNRKVALKKLPERFAVDPLFLRRFRNEAQAAATLNHPNVATIYSVEEMDGKPFITMEYVEGQTLEAILQLGGLPIKTLLEWFSQIAEALLHAHEKGVIHRDIKPGNIMIAPAGIPKILDFGLAQVAGIEFESVGERPTITQPGQIIGTPSYMSPEQAQGKDVDHRVDIFSLGVVMFEAAAGTRPFTGESNAELISNLLKTDPPLVSEIRSDVPSLVARLIDRCLRKSRRERVQSMQEIRTVLDEANTFFTAGISTGSLGRRLYRETIWSGWRWRVGAVAAALLLAVGGWYYFSRPGTEPPVSFEKMAMRRLSQAGNVVTAVIAPDGKSIVYGTSEENGDRALWLRRVDDSNALQLLSPQPVQFWGGVVFSNDGGHIYFITAGRSAAHGTLWRVSTLGGQPRKLVDSINHFGSVSPDGERMLYVRYGDLDPSRSARVSDTQILSANAADGGDERPILGARGETVFKDPQFSPDGRSIYFIKRELVNGIEFWSIVMIPADGVNETRILRQKERIGELTTLRNSNGFLITADDPVSKLHQIYYVSAADGKKTRITNDLNFYVGVSIDRAERSIVAAQRSDENRVWVGDAGSLASLKPITKEANAQSTVDWTPDGRLVYDAYENNLSHIFIADASGKNPQQLTGPASDDSQPRVSGDGRYIVFTSRRAGFSQIWRMNIDGSNQAPISDIPGISETPRFAADGRTVVFRWYREGGPPLARVDIMGGAVEGVEGIPPASTYFWAMSPDGRQVAYTVRDESIGRVRVAVRQVGSAEPSALLDIWPSRIFKWLPDGAGIYYQERQEGEGLHAKVFEVDLAQRKPKLLLSTEPETVLDLTYSRDAKRIALVRGRSVSDAVLLTAASSGK